MTEWSLWHYFLYYYIIKFVLQLVYYAPFLQQSVRFFFLTYFFISQIIRKINLKTIIRYTYNL